ncbi:MAG: alpha/beta hydrolase [Kouleothrix sp.]
MRPHAPHCGLPHFGGLTGAGSGQPEAERNPYHYSTGYRASTRPAAAPTINGVELAYRDQGAGEAILLIHAFPLSSAMWEDQIDALSALPRDRARPARLWGNRTRRAGQPRPGPPTTWRRCSTTWACARPAWSACSMGGYIAFFVLRRHRQRVARLVLADTRAGAERCGTPGPRAERAVGRGQGADAVAEQMLPRLLSAGADPAVRAEVRAIIAANDRAGIAAAQRAMAARPDSLPLLATIAVPSLILVGSADVLTPPSEARPCTRPSPAAG